MQTTDYFEKGKELGKFCVQTGITTSQLRKFLSLVNVLTNKVKNNEEKWDKIVEELDYLKVKLAYQAGRDNETKFVINSNGYRKAKKDEQFNKKLKPLVEFYNKIEPEINKAKNKENYENFAKLIETILAFHKYEGGKD